MDKAAKPPITVISIRCFLYTLYLLNSRISCVICAFFLPSTDMSWVTTLGLGSNVVNLESCGVCYTIQQKQHPVFQVLYQEELPVHPCYLNDHYRSQVGCSQRIQSCPYCDSFHFAVT